MRKSRLLREQATVGRILKVTTQGCDIAVAGACFSAMSNQPCAHLASEAIKRGLSLASNEQRQLLKSLPGP